LLTGGLFFFVLGTILAAGLWPFNPAPSNEVSWLKGRNGLAFGPNGIVVSSSLIQLPDPGSSFVSLEIWVKPSQQRETTSLLSTYVPKERLRFRLMNYGIGLLVVRGNARLLSRNNEIPLGNVLIPDRSVFITITGGLAGAIVYVNGEKVEAHPHFDLTRQDLSGEVMLGTSPVYGASWCGELMGLAIYTSELSPSQVKTHYRKWTENRELDLAQEESPAALYDFHEGSGQIIHNLGNGAADLVIPIHYSVPYKPFLERPWNEFLPKWSYLKDVVKNTVGFVPLGIFAYAFLAHLWPSRRAIWTAILIGMATSITIEVLQAFIPSRSSGMTDILTNTAGTSIGVFLCTQPKLKELWVLACRLSQSNLSIDNLA
jgi:VanZ family protein